MADNIFADSFGDAYNEVDEFFWNIEKNGGFLNINGVEFSDRQDQNKYALAVMDAIKEKSILLIEAGVGIGKSFGYLIPIFFTMNNVTTFKQVVISTSTMALQNQLLSDVNKVSNMLDIDVKVVVVKGIHNYVCLKNLEFLMIREKDQAKKKQYEKIEQEIMKKQSADRSDLMEISNSIWQKVKASDRGVCSKCCYSKECFYQRHLANIQKMDDENEKFILVTNHAFLSYLLKYKSDILKRTDSFVIDEAHKFEENVRNLNEYSIELKNVNDCIGKIQRALGDKTSRGLIKKITDLYSEIFKTIERMKNNDARYDSEKVPFNYNAYVKEKLEVVINGIGQYIKDVNSRCYGNIKLMRSVNSNLVELNRYFELFSDMYSPDSERKNIYWAQFYDSNRISLHYSSKSLNKELRGLFNRDRETSVILTSGTLGYDRYALENDEDREARELEETKKREEYKKKNPNLPDTEIVVSLPKKGFYSLVDQGLGLEGMKRIVETPLKSPYDFTNNSLLYYNPNLISPKFDFDSGIDTISSSDYYEELANEINRLIRLTNGKCLILFTSKEDMKKVYKIINEKYSYSFNLFIQSENNSNTIKQEFASDINSVLFATGTFWEGIDVKGKSLSNLIICKLPFSNLDPILEGKASSYTSDKRFKKIYFRDMMVKLKQGIGRLIRSEDDTGIVCVLDPRVDGYNKEILEELDLPYTTSYEKLKEFVDEKGISDDISIHKSR